MADQFHLHTGLTFYCPGPLVTAKADSNFLLIPATKTDVEEHFTREGTGKITEIKLMNGFGFIEYDDPLDARDIVPSKIKANPPRSFLQSFRPLLTYSFTVFRMEDSLFPSFLLLINACRRK